MGNARPQYEAQNRESSVKDERWVKPFVMCRCRLFLKRLKSSLKIPVLALVDSDPYGLKILSVYMKVGTSGEGGGSSEGMRDRGIYR